MDFPNQNTQLFVLASLQDDGNLAILCRTTGPTSGPAYCNSKKNAIKLKTKLLNDPRGIANHRAMELIKNLIIYKVEGNAEPVWEEGDLWAYLPSDYAKSVESMFTL